MAQKPELRLTQEPLLKIAKENEWHLFRVDSSAVYNPATSCYLHSQAPLGTSDLLGTTPHGFSAYIECKAPGKLSTLREAQRSFLIQGIEHFGFAIVTDHPSKFLDYYQTFLNLSRCERKKYLYTLLPKAKKIKLPTSCTI